MIQSVNCGWSPKSGKPGDDSSDLSAHFELGWEVVGSRISLFQLLVENKVDENTVIYTAPGRECLYDSFFKTIKTSPDGIEDVCVNYVTNRNYDFCFGKKPEIKRTCIFPEILKENLSKFSILDKPKVKNKFVCICIRIRDHGSYRNINKKYFSDLIQKYVTENYDVYLVGFGSDEFIKENVYAVSLREFSYLTSHSLCKGVIGPPTGTLLLAHFSSRDGVPIVCVDEKNERLPLLEQNNGILGGPIIAYKKSFYYISLGLRNVDDLFSEVKKFEDKEHFYWTMKKDNLEIFTI